MSENTVERISTIEKEWLRALDNMPDGTLFRSVRDVQTGIFRFDYVGTTWEKITGVSAENTLADSNNVFVNVPPEDLKTLFRNISESDDKRLKFADEVRYIHPISKKTCWFQISSYYSFHEKSMISSCGFVFDITSRKETELELFMEKSRLQAFNSMPDGTVFRSARDMNTGILKFDYVGTTWEKFTGVSVEESLADMWNVFKYVPPEDFKELMQRITESLGPLLKFDVEVRYMHPVEKRELWLHIWSYPRRNDGYIYSDGFIFDVTERKNNEIELAKYREQLEFLVKERTEELQVVNEELTSVNEELHKYQTHLEELVEQRTVELVRAREKAEESDNLKSAFLASISHEIRTPMNAIMGFLNIINLEAQMPDYMREYIELVNSNSIRLLKHIESIVDVAKIATLQMDIPPVKLNINAMMTELKILWETNIQAGNKSHLEIILDDSDFISPCILLVDATRLRQVFEHLFENAVKFTERGYIRFGYSQPSPKFFEFFVEDTGIGMSPDLIEVVFEPFRQAELGASRRYEGAGLGLTLVRGLIVLMGGDMRVESAKDKGSTFYFTVPNVPD
jgi:signal transduction histidine kinase